MRLILGTLELRTAVIKAISTPALEGLVQRREPEAGVTRFIVEIPWCQGAGVGWGHAGKVCRSLALLSPCSSNE